MAKREERQMDESITTVGDMFYALDQLQPRLDANRLQMYVQLSEDDSLITVTEVMQVLLKNSKEVPYIVLRVG